MKLNEIGEFGLIDRLAEMAEKARDGRQTAWQRLVTGIGDDAALWQGDTRRQLATIDSMIEGIHFTQDTLEWADLGWKALAVNLSDIAAMGGEPRYALVSLALPDETELDDVMAMYRGMLALAEETGVAVVGGDTCRAGVVMVTIAVFGIAGENDSLSRSSARPGDLLAVTGWLGSAAAGLEMRRNDLEFDRPTQEMLEESFSRPKPRVVEGQRLLAGGVKAAIDISDGLLADLGHICQRSGVGAHIEVEKLPVHPLVRSGFGERALVLVLTGGEDYELIFTADAPTMDKMKEALGCPVTVIGEITAGNAGEVTLLDGRGEQLAFNRKGWEHFHSV